MGLDIWFVEDIRNALLAAKEGGNPSLKQVMAFLSYLYVTFDGPVTAVEEAYKQGHRDALVTLALAFGLSPVGAELRALTFEAKSGKIEI